eukprot:366247-Chlamydomonas_euryale.AAC.6
MGTGIVATRASHLVLASIRVEHPERRVAQACVCSAACTRCVTARTAGNMHGNGSGRRGWGGVDEGGKRYRGDTGRAAKNAHGEGLGCRWAAAGVRATKGAEARVGEAATFKTSLMTGSMTS